MKLLVWDFDGTLAYRDGMWSGTLAELLQLHAPSFLDRRADLRAALQTGFPWHSPDVPHPELSDPDAWWNAIAPTFERAFLAAGVDWETSATLARRVRFHYCDHRGWALFPDSMSTLEHLSARGWTHVMLSNHVPELPEIVRQLGLGRFFLRITNSAATGYEKPHARAFAAAINGLDSFRDRWMVGDSMSADICGAERCGWNAILVRRAHPEARHYCESLSDVIAMLDNQVETRPDAPVFNQ